MKKSWAEIFSYENECQGKHHPHNRIFTLLMSGRHTITNGTFAARYFNQRAGGGNSRQIKGELQEILWGKHRIFNGINILEIS